MLDEACAIHYAAGTLHDLGYRKLKPEGFKPKVGHIVMPPQNGLHIKSPHDAWLAEQLLTERANGRPLRPDSWQA